MTYGAVLASLWTQDLGSQPGAVDPPARIDAASATIVDDVSGPRMT